jgi:uncharacterized membrane protein YeiB
MCQTPEESPSLSAVWANLRQPGPLEWKVRRVLANTRTKILRRQTCCGHPGEPGC